MAFRVVEAAEDDVLEAETALVAPVLLSEQRQKVEQSESLLCRHHREAFLGEGVVEADSNVAVALLKEAFHAFPYANGRDRDALRTPSPPVGSREQLRGSEHGIEVVHRLALSHEDDVGELFASGHRIDLVQDVGGGEVSSEALPARHAEAAPHAAACLTADAERCPVVVRDIDALHLLSAFRREEVFGRSVRALLYVAWRYAAYLVVLREGRPAFQREVGHLFDAVHMLPVDPFRHLLCSKTGQSDLRGHSLQFVECHAEQLLHLFSFL